MLRNLFKNPQRTGLLVVAVLIVIASFLRLWQIRDYQVFLGDEGRDVLLVRQMIQDKRPVFIGPTASVGGFYLGPIYYWMSAPFLFLFNYDPTGPAVMVALFGIATVVLLYKLLKDQLGIWPAALVGLLYATSPLIVRYSRSSWNPNPLPFFALLLIFALYQGIKTKKLIYFLLAGACFGVAIQLHYLAVMLAPIAALIVLVNANVKKIPIIILLAAIGAIITFSPFLAFEIRHDFPNYKTISEFVTRSSTHGFKSLDLFWLITNFGNILLENISKFAATPITKIALWVIILSNIYGLRTFWKDKDKRLIFSIGLVYFLGGLIFLRYYSGQIHDYYFGFMFPAPFIAVGLMFYLLWQNKYTKFLPIILTAIAVVQFLTHEFYTGPPNRLIIQTETVADFVIEKTENKPYNFALITDHNSDHAYRYFLEIEGYKPTTLETMVTDQLLVVCESEKCAPLGHPIWEIAGFGQGEIVGEWKIPDIGITVLKLKHLPGVPNPAGKPAVKGG